MTTEDEFQALLDANPQDYHTRLVFADWLQERSDPRAEGYRALGRLELVPDRYGNYDNLREDRGYPDRCYWGRRENSNYDWWVRQGSPTVPCLLIERWFKELKKVKGYDTLEKWWVYYKNRRDAENAAALAFGRLPRAVRTKLLAGAK